MLLPRCYCSGKTNFRWYLYRKLGIYRERGKGIRAQYARFIQRRCYHVGQSFLLYIMKGFWAKWISWIVKCILIFDKTIPVLENGSQSILCELQHLTTRQSNLTFPLHNGGKWPKQAFPKKHRPRYFARRPILSLHKFFMGSLPPPPPTPPPPLMSKFTLEFFLKPCCQG